MKPRRDITLGEMQDECRRFESPLCGGKACAYVDLCNQMKSGYTPHAWDLSDPPRFTEAQMAFWRALYEMGVESVAQRGSHVAMFNRLDILVGDFAWRGIETGIKADEKIDLSELLGKDRSET